MVIVGYWLPDFIIVPLKRIATNARMIIELLYDDKPRSGETIVATGFNPW